MQTDCCPLQLFVALKNVIYGTILITTNFKQCFIFYSYICADQSFHMSKCYTMVLQMVNNVIKLSNSKILDPTEHALWRMLKGELLMKLVTLYLFF